jgi:hypothetical protein
LYSLAKIIPTVPINAEKLIPKMKVVAWGISSL